MRAEERAVGKAQVLVVGSVRGLVSEAAVVESLFHQFSPGAAALGVGPRELDEIQETLAEKGEAGGAHGGAGATRARKKVGPTGLEDKVLEPADRDSEFEDFGLFISSSDMVFLRRLSRFGDVEMPPPSYQALVRAARAKGVAVAAIDMDDDAYTDVFIEHVKLFDLWRQGRNLRKLTRRKFDAPTAEALAYEWDRRLNRRQAYRRIEMAREEKIAVGIAALAEEFGRVIAVVELERMDGVLAELGKLSQARAHAAAPPSPAPEGSPSGA